MPKAVQTDASKQTDVSHPNESYQANEGHQATPVDILQEHKTEPAPPEANKSIIGATFLISAATLLSRIFGLLRDQLSAALLGTGFYGDAFNLAFRLPNLLRDLFAEGGLSVAFQPVFAKRLREQGRNEAYRLANLVLTLLLAVVSILVVAGIIFSPALVRFWGPGFMENPAKYALAVQLTQILMPFLLFISIAAVMMAMLNAERRFLWPALSSVFFNLAAIAMGFYLIVSKTSNLKRIAILWSVGTLLGAVFQLLVQVPSLIRQGYRFRPSLDPRFRDPGLRTILRNFVPILIGVLPVQMSVYINTSFVSRTDRATVWLIMAFRLIQVFVGLFGVSIGTVALARYTQSSFEKDAQAYEGIRVILRKGLRMVILLTLPVCVGLWLLSEPLIRLLFQHGRFSSADTIATAHVLRLYSLGLLAYGALKVVVPAFYALGRSRIPMLGAFLAMSVHVVISALFYRVYGYSILVVGVVLSAWFNLLFVLIMFQRFYGGLWQQEFGQSFFKMTLSAGFLAGLLKGISSVYLWFYQTRIRFWTDLVFLAVCVLASVLFYGGLCHLFGVEEVKEMMTKIRTKVFRKDP